VKHGIIRNASDAFPRKYIVVCPVQPHHESSTIVRTSEVLNVRTASISDCPTGRLTQHGRRANDCVGGQGHGQRGDATHNALHRQAHQAAPAAADRQHRHEQAWRRRQEGRTVIARLIQGPLHHLQMQEQTLPKLHCRSARHFVPPATRLASFRTVAQRRHVRQAQPRSNAD